MEWWICNKDTSPPFEVEEGGCRQRPPSILWFGRPVLFEYSSFDHFPNKNKLCYFARFHCGFACGLVVTTSALNAGDRALSPHR